MGTIRCLIFIAEQIAARSAFRRKGPICARPLEWGPLLPTLRRAASPRRAALSRLSISSKAHPRLRKMHRRKRIQKVSFVISRCQKLHNVVLITYDKRRSAWRRWYLNTWYLNTRISLNIL